MLQQLFGTELAFPIRVAVALGVVAALLGATVVLMRRLADRNRANTPRDRGGPRLAVVESLPLDQRRKLVLVRRDEVEHLLVIGGSSDLVVEPLIGATAAPAAGALPPGAFAPAPLAPAREAPALPRAPARQRLGATNAPSTLAAPAVDAPAEPFPVAVEASEAPTPEAATREVRRPPIARKPLLRGDGTMSVARPAPRPAGEPEAVPAPVAATRADAKVDSPSSTDQSTEMTAADDAAAQDEGAADRLEAMVQRLDAALREPAPQISLNDLLEDAPAPAAPAERTAPRIIQRPRNEPRVAFEPSRGRTDPLPRFERPISAPAPAAVPEVAPMRLREFAFRPTDTGETRDEPRREPVVPGIAAIAPPVTPAPALIVPPASDPRPLPPRAEEAPAAVAPAVASLPSPAKAESDPLDDFDAEMADLLGRSTARGR